MPPFDRCLVTGTGQGGTNLLVEYVRVTNLFEFTDHVEDRRFFFHKELPEGYGTKLAVENPGYTEDNFVAMMRRYPAMVVMFALRHPVDCCLSKVFRGQLKSRGGDCDVEDPGANVEIAIARYRAMLHVLATSQDQFKDRTFSFRMEDIIEHPRQTAQKICAALGTASDDEFAGAYKNNRNLKQNSRYTKLDNSQIALWKRAGEVYDGFFADKPELVDIIFESMTPVAKQLGYEVGARP